MINHKANSPFGVLILIVLLMMGLNTYSIPDSLKSGADAVYKRHITNIELVSAKKMIVTKIIEVTVLNEKGRSHTDFTVDYDSDQPIKSMTAELFDANGKKIKSYKGRDIKDYSQYSGSTLFHDNRQKQIEVYAPQYPYTATFEYTQEFKEYIGIPSWYPQVGYRVSVLYSSYTILHREDFSLKYRLFNIGEPKIEFPKPGIKSLTWEQHGLKPIESEYFSSRFFETTPAVLLVPECFSYKGTNGCYTSWETYGEWVSSMIKDRADFTENMQLKVQELISGVHDDIEKVKIIYKYMQNRTRYVSIQLGIGGYQPFPASEVETTGYGDCKALANYTKTLLRLGGIKSHYTEIGVSNTQIMFDDFPSAWQTNHIVLCVPLESDTIWLECTSQQYPFGYLPYSMQGQKVLLVDEEEGNGRLVNTPTPDASYNSRHRNINLEINAEGNAHGTMTTIVRGGEMSDLFPELWQPHKERERIINNKYSIPGFRLKSFNYNLYEGDTTWASEDISMAINKFTSQTGNRLFIKANVFGGIGNIPAKSNKRRSELVLKHSYTYIDSVTVKIPEGYKIEHLPSTTSTQNPFGSLRTEFSSTDATIKYVRSLIVNRYKGPASEYNNFIDFLLEVNRVDNQNIVFVKEI
ncbi:MAG: hypothetical protein CVT98_02485 [Bacteroidetes bacterium HGW-Bacteroidetes-15]|nr:MAG: hypothetical protein CVT98_02485 [Bacteroidetes bacterium HGW-Bacteroidetes-15]